ncbi:TPA: hypothetical protein QHL53_000921 [Proteus mirabilis]|nr:hypothetical protein [Proteus mirabilis]
MLYYIYVLSGPLKGIITPLLPNQYSLILHSTEHIENKVENEKLTLYIPCNKKEHEKIITIILDEHNTKNNKYKIEDSLNSKEISKELPLELDKPIYINNLPIFLISYKDDLSITSFDLNSKKWTINRKIIVSFILVIVFFIISFSFINVSKPLEKKPKELTFKSIYSNEFKGKNGYLCIYIAPYDSKNLIKNSELKTKNLFLNKEKIIRLTTNNKIHVTLKDNTKPIVSFFYYNKNEKLKIIQAINENFPKNCQPIIKELSIAKIIEDINKLSFTKTIGYTIEEKNNGLTFIFDEELNVNDKEKFNTYIKKQTAIFGRKFIFYRENKVNNNLKNKAMLQEDNGYIFLDNQHRYFPQG